MIICFKFSHILPLGLKRLLLLCNWIYFSAGVQISKNSFNVRAPWFHRNLATVLKFAPNRWRGGFASRRHWWSDVQKRSPNSARSHNWWIAYASSLHLEIATLLLCWCSEYWIHIFTVQYMFTCYHRFLQFCYDWGNVLKDKNWIALTPEINKLQLHQ